jgi:hypothetical protein
VRVETGKPPNYLEPYIEAARRHGPGFGSLLWASPVTQAARFDAFTRLCDFHGKSILDAGCGRADFLDFLLNRGIVPDHYVGLEAVETLAAAAERKRHRNCTIVRADFVCEPARLLVGADLVVFSGSLNTLDVESFTATVHIAFEAAGERLVFNFLSSSSLAAARFLTWHRTADVRHLAQSLTSDVQSLEDYLAGDCTVALRKAE